MLHSSLYFKVWNRQSCFGKTNYIVFLLIVYRYFLHSHINHNWINGRLFIDKSDIIIFTLFIPVQQTSLDSHKSSYSLVQSDAFVFFILFSESLHTNDRMSMNGLVYQAYCQRLHWSWTGSRPISDEVFTVCR